MKRRLSLHLFFAIAAAFAIPALAQYPGKAIQLVVPFSPGTATDLVARHVAPRLSKALGVPVVIDNKLGAAGQIGTKFVASAVPDGHTLLFTSSAHYINKNLNKTLSYDPIADFSPVMGMSNTLLVLIVPKSVPVNTLAELIQYAKARPGKLSYSSAGVGSTTHLPSALFNTMAGLDIVHVPYKSGAQAVTDVIGDQVFMTITGLATALPHIKSGSVKGLAVTGAKRSASLPEIPTMAEAGNLPGYEFSAFAALLAPAKTPDAIIRKLESTMLEIANQPDFKALLLAGAVELDPMSRARFLQQVAADMPRWEQMVKMSGAQPE
jgi:tripartite-type tricarboxylate transporter receptor subunit TctC